MTNPKLIIPDGWAFTRVGDVLLPELPTGWPVAWDTEGSGLAVDGDPFTVAGRPAAPPARISAVSVSFRWPNADGTPGELVDFAWPFDQGPVLGKPGSPIKDPITSIVTFKPIDRQDQADLLARASRALGYTVTPEMAMPNLHPDEYGALVMWLDARDNLAAHNSVHDMHQMRTGLRADAGGFGGPEGLWAWDPDTEPGSLTRAVENGDEPSPRLHMMEPTLEPLRFAKRRRNIWCTMVVQKQVVDPLQPAALKPTSRRLWGDDSADEETALKTELSKQGTGLTKRYDLLPWCGAVGEYAAKDTNLCYRLWEYQDKVADEGVLPKFWDLINTEMTLRTTLYRMERRGVAYDAEESFEVGRQTREANTKAARPMPFNPAKPAEAKRFYYGPVCGRACAPTEDCFRLCAKSCPECGGKNGLGLEPTNRTAKTRAPQLDIPELRKLVGEGRPWAKEYMAWTKRRNSDSKWYTGWAARTGQDGRIRTSFKQCKNDRERAGSAEGGTKSGRLAVGRWQCQAIPHEHLIPEGFKPVRKLIGQVPPGTRVVRYDGTHEETKVRRVMHEHDLAAGEMRVVVVIANSVKLWDALDAGADTHGMNATAFFGVDKDHPDFKMLRNGAKRGTFGVLYGGGVKAIHEQIEAATGMKFPQARIKEAIENFFVTYPEFKLLTRQAEHKVTRWMGGCGYLTMLDGWRRWYAEDEKTNSAVNQIIQGNLARAMIYWMAEVERRVPGCLLLQIHDSLITEHDDTPEGEKEAQLVSEIGQEVFEKYFSVRGRVMNFGISPDRWDDKG